MTSHLGAAFVDDLGIVHWRSRAVVGDGVDEQRHNHLRTRTGNMMFWLWDCRRRYGDSQGSGGRYLSQRPEDVTCVGCLCTL